MSNHVDPVAHRRDALRTLLATKALYREEVTLSTGTKADFYFDCKKVMMAPEGSYLMARTFLDNLDAFPARPAAVGGMADGATVIAGPMVVLSKLREDDDHPAVAGFFVRKEAKAHGMKRAIENPPPKGSRVVIVDDVVTTGGSLLRAVEAVREAGCEVVGAMALVDREVPGVQERICTAARTFRPIFRRSDFPEIDGETHA